MLMKHFDNHSPDPSDPMATDDSARLWYELRIEDRRRLIDQKLAWRRGRHRVKTHYKSQVRD
jgi:hypothetical protein